MAHTELTHTPPLPGLTYKTVNWTCKRRSGEYIRLRIEILVNPVI